MTDCLFCRIVSREISAEIKHEEETWLAIRDIHPQAPVHLLILPKKHIASIADADPLDAPVLGEIVYGAKWIAHKEKWSDYRLVFNNGPGAGQSVFHIHLHLLSGRPMAWPPG